MNPLVLQLTNTKLNTTGARQITQEGGESGDFAATLQRSLDVKGESPVSLNALLTESFVSNELNRASAGELSTAEDVLVSDEEADSEINNAVMDSILAMAGWQPSMTPLFKEPVDKLSSNREIPDTASSHLRSGLNVGVLNQSLVNVNNVDGNVPLLEQEEGVLSNIGHLLSDPIQTSKNAPSFLSGDKSSKNMAFIQSMNTVDLEMPKISPPQITEVGISGGEAFGSVMSQSAMQVPVLGDTKNTLAPSSANAAMAQYTLTEQMGSAGWVPGLGSTLRLMSQHHQTSATLEINPQELGPISITLSMDNTNNSPLQVAFVAASAETRQTLEQSLPQLKGWLSDQGIQLEQASVGDHASSASSGQQNSGQEGGFGRSQWGSGYAGGDGEMLGDGVTEVVLPIRDKPAGNVDTFA
jgi:hypothetical protein